MFLQSGEEYCEIGVTGHGIMVDMADDGSEGSGLCYQMCTSALSRGTYSVLEVNDLHFSKQGCIFFDSFLQALLSLCAYRRVLVTQHVVHGWGCLYLL